MKKALGKEMFHHHHGQFPPIGTSNLLLAVLLNLLDLLECKVDGKTMAIMPFIFWSLYVHHVEWNCPKKCRSKVGKSMESTPEVGAICHLDLQKFDPQEIQVLTRPQNRVEASVDQTLFNMFDIGLVFFWAVWVYVNFQGCRNQKLLSVC